MKKVFTILFVLVSFLAKSQTPPGYTKFYSNNMYLGVGADSSLLMPFRDTVVAPARIGEIRLRISGGDTSVYVATRTTGRKWQRIATGAASATWGTITGTLSAQTDLQTALNAKQNTITTGLSSQYLRGNLTLGTFSSDVISVTSGLYSLLSHTHSGLNPIGGTTGQILKKNSNTDYDYSWQNEGAGYVPVARTLTINGVTYDLSLDRSWTVGDVTQSQLDDTASAIRSSISGGSSTKFGKPTEDFNMAENRYANFHDAYNFNLDSVNQLGLYRSGVNRLYFNSVATGMAAPANNYFEVSNDSSVTTRKISYSHNINGTLITPNSLVTRSLVDSLITVSTPTLQQVTNAGSTTTNSFGVINNDLGAISVTNTGATKSASIQIGINSGYLNLSQEFSSATFAADDITGSRTYQARDKSGTLALLSDITDSIAAHGGGSQSLQDVTNVNNETTNDIYINRIDGSVTVYNDPNSAAARIGIGDIFSGATYKGFLLLTDDVGKGTYLAPSTPNTAEILYLPQSTNDTLSTMEYARSVGGGSGYTVANEANNRIVTSVSAGNGNAEANLTFDGSALTVTGLGRITDSLRVPKITGGSATNSPLTLQATEGIAASGADIIFKPGNSTEAFRMYSDGTAYAIHGLKITGDMGTYTGNGLEMRLQTSSLFSLAFFDRGGGTYINSTFGAATHQFNTGATSNLPAMLLSGQKAFIGGSTTPTAVLNLAAGTATASTAPLKFTTAASVLNTTAETGAMEVDSSNIYYSSGIGVNLIRTTLARTLTATATLNFGNTVAGAGTDLTITVNGAVIGDAVFIGVDNASVSATDNVSFWGWVSSANTITIRFNNNNLVNAVDPASGTFRAVVVKY